MERQLLLAKVEATYGTDAAPLAVNSVWAEGVDYKPTGERVTPDPAKPGVGPVADHTYGEHAVISWRIPLAASGEPGVPPAWGFMMEALGWIETIDATEGDESVTYSLMPNPTAGAKSLTLMWRDAKRAHKVLGFRGRAGVELTPGQRPMLVITGKGIYVPVAAGAELTHADANFAEWLDAKPVANGTTAMSFAGIANLGIREFSFEQSDNVVFTDLPGQEQVELAGARTFTGNMKVSTPEVGTLSLEGKWSNGDVEEFSVSHGLAQGAGHIVTVNGRAQVSDAPTYARENGQDTAANPLKLVPSSLTTDDDLAIICT